MICPCIECLLIPVCKNKSWNSLVPQCSHVYTYIYRYSDKSHPNMYSKIKQVKNTLNTYLWSPHYEPIQNKLYVSTTKG